MYSVRPSSTRRFRATSVACFVCLVLATASCSPGDPENSEGNDLVAWSDVQESSFLSSVEVAVYTAPTIYEENSSAKGAVVFVAADGTTRTLETEPQDNGLIHFGSSGLLWSGNTTSYRVDAAES